MSVEAIITIDYLENAKSKKTIHAFNTNVLDKGDDVDLGKLRHLTACGKKPSPRWTFSASSLCSPSST
jgi:hypothetical protein